MTAHAPGATAAAPPDPAAPLGRIRSAEPAGADRRFWLLLGLLSLLALAVRVDFVRNEAPPVPPLGDAHAYHVLAAQLAAGRGYIRPYDFERTGQVVRTAEYPPVFPALLAAADDVGLRSVDQQRLLLCLLGSVTVLVTGLAGRRLGGPTVGLLAAGVAAVYPMLFQADGALMPETLAALGGAAVLLLALRARGRPSFAPWVALGAVIGVSILARAEAALLLPVLVAPMIWRLHGVAARRRLTLGLAAFAVAGAVVVPWTVRNALAFHELVPVSNNLGSVARGANCDLAYHGRFRGLWVTSVGDANGLSSVDPQNRCFSRFPIRRGVNEAAAAAELRAKGLRYARDHAGSLPGVMLARLGRTFGVYRVDQQTGFESFEGRNVVWQRRGTRFFYVLAVLAVAGAVVLFRRREAVWPPVAMVLAVALTTMLTYGNQRFRASAEPAVIVLAAVTVVAAAQRATAWATDVRTRAVTPRR